jgi:hypothetical protein
MSFSTISHRLLLSCKEELDKPENREILRKDIIQPAVSLVIEELYPYFVGGASIIAGIVLMIVLILILNIRICYR